MVKILVGNVGVVLGIFSLQNDRHANMSAQCCRHNTYHVSNIALCRLVGRHVGVVLAHINCDVLAPSQQMSKQANKLHNERMSEQVNEQTS